MSIFLAVEALCDSVLWDIFFYIILSVVEINSLFDASIHCFGAISKDYNRLICCFHCHPSFILSGASLIILIPLSIFSCSKSLIVVSYTLFVLIWSMGTPQMIIL